MGAVAVSLCVFIPLHVPWHWSALVWSGLGGLGSFINIIIDAFPVIQLVNLTFPHYQSLPLLSLSSSHLPFHLQQNSREFKSMDAIFGLIIPFLFLIFFNFECSWDNASVRQVWLLKTNIYNVKLTIINKGNNI